MVTERGSWLQRGGHSYRDRAMTTEGIMITERGLRLQSYGYTEGVLVTQRSHGYTEGS